MIGLFKPGLPERLELRLAPLPTGQITAEASDVDFGSIMVSWMVKAGHS